MRPEGEGETETGTDGGGGEAEGGGAREEGGAQTTTAATTTTTTNTAAASTTTNARSRPPSPPPPLTIPNSNRSHPSTSGTAGATAAATSSNGDAPDVTSEDRPPVSHGTDSSSSGSSQVPSRQDGNEGGAPDIAGDNVATGASSSEPAVPVLSGIDALLSIDVSTGNGNETQPLPTLPASSSTTESAAIGTLIDFGSSNSDSSTPVVSTSQSTFHSIPQPTPEQISEMEAAIGALNEHMTRIRERTE